MRKYNISATVVLQDISQIEAMYKDNWKELVANCSSIVLLGSNEQNTLKYFSEKLDASTITTKSRGESKGGHGGSNVNFQNTKRELMTAEEIGRMPSDECIVFTQNMRPVKDKKYKYEKHPRYQCTGDASDDWLFLYHDNPAYNNSNNQVFKSFYEGFQKSARIEEQKLITDVKKDPDKINLLKEKGLPALDTVKSWIEDDNDKKRKISTEQQVYGEAMKAAGEQKVSFPVGIIRLDYYSSGVMMSAAKKISIDYGCHIFMFGTLKSEDKRLYGVLPYTIPGLRGYIFPKELKESIESIRGSVKDVEVITEKECLRFTIQETRLREFFEAFKKIIDEYIAEHPEWLDVFKRKRS